MERAAQLDVRKLNRDGDDHVTTGVVGMSTCEELEGSVGCVLLGRVLDAVALKFTDIIRFWPCH